jgi:LPXTG-motif cell wall-anchored protein
MKRTTRSRLTSALGAFGLAGAMLLGPLGLQGAGADLKSFASSADGYALRVVVDLSVLPAEAKAPIQAAYTTLRSSLLPEAQALLPAQFDFMIDQRFIETITDAKAGVTQADAYLARGLANFPTASSSGMDKSQSTTTDERRLPTADLGILDLATGLLKTSVVSGPKVDASATLSEVDVALDELGSLLPTELQGAFDELQAAVNAAIATADAALDAPLTTIAESVTAATSNPAFAPVVGLLPEGTVPTVDNLTAELQDAITLPALADVLGPELASIKGLVDSSTAQQSPSKALADAAAKITSVDVLGLISVGLIDVSSHSEAAGTPGTARNTNNCSVADARLGGNDGVSLDGKSIYVAGARVPVATGAVGEVKSAVDSVLSAAGLSVALCDAVESAAAEDGTTASQTMSAFRVVFAPLAPADITGLGISLGDPLIRVIIDPTVQTVVAAQAQIAEDEAGPSLPRTGASIALTVLIGTALAAGSYMLWRRTRSSH